MNPPEPHVSHHWADPYLIEAVLQELRRFSQGKPLRLVDVGCGDGFAASRYTAAGHAVRGFDISATEIARAKAAYPGLDLRVASLYDAEAMKAFDEGASDAVLALEVVEHLFEPGKLFEVSRRFLRPGGLLIASTPYHGYAKNLAISLLDGWDRHHMVHSDGGHIKFFSKKTLARAAREGGFSRLRFRGAGRVPYFWKSVILIGEK